MSIMLKIIDKFKTIMDICNNNTMLCKVKMWTQEVCHNNVPKKEDIQ